MQMIEMSDRVTQLEQMLRRRIVILDGAMGTMIQMHSLTEADFRGQPFADHPCDLKGCNDLLSITQPAIIEAIHRQYLAPGPISSKPIHSIRRRSRWPIIDWNHWPMT